MISAVLCAFVGFRPLSWEEGLTDFSETQTRRTGAGRLGAPATKDVFYFLHGL